MYNLAIIGGGPAGYTAAEKATKAGMKVLLIEKETVGGTCLNVGCIPTKTLLYSAKQYVHAKQADKYGVKATDVTFDYGRIQMRKQKIVRKLVAGVKARLQGVDLVLGEAKVTGWSEDKVTLVSGETTYEAERLLIATGSSNFVPPIPGIEGNEHIWNSTDALAAKELPQSVAIIGGGVIGMEFATLYMELGIEVTVIEAMPTILPNIDAELVTMLREKYEKQGVRILTCAKVEHVDGGKVYYESVVTGEKAMVEAEKVLVCVGRRPNMAGLETLPLEIEGRGIKVNEMMQTNLANVYAAGDVTCKIMLAHVASRQAEVAVAHMIERNTTQRINYKAIPSVVYTNPEIASVGMMQSSEGTYEEKKLPMTYSGRFVAENEAENGLCKMLTDPSTGKIVGVHMLGNPCSEFVSAASIAVTKGYTTEEMEQVVFPHPTVSEILKEIL